VRLYILDGHHKIAAAAQAALTVQFLIYLPHGHLGRALCPGLDVHRDTHLRSQVVQDVNRLVKVWA
jgi:hypothetical protein